MTLSEIRVERCPDCGAPMNICFMFLPDGRVSLDMLCGRCCRLVPCGAVEYDKGGAHGERKTG